MSLAMLFFCLLPLHLPHSANRHLILLSTNKKVYSRRIHIIFLAWFGMWVSHLSVLYDMGKCSWGKGRRRIQLQWKHQEFLHKASALLKICGLSWLSICEKKQCFIFLIAIARDVPETWTAWSSFVEISTSLLFFIHPLLRRLLTCQGLQLDKLLMQGGGGRNDWHKLYWFNEHVNLRQHYSEQVQLSKCHKYILRWVISS